MHITIAAVGKAKHKPEAELIAHYLKQTRWDIAIKEIPDAPSNMTADARRAREAEGFQKLLTPQTRLFVMDSTGKSALNSLNSFKMLRKMQLSTPYLRSVGRMGLTPRSSNPHTPPSPSVPPHGHTSCCAPC